VDHPLTMSSQQFDRRSSMQIDRGSEGAYEAYNEEAFRHFLTIERKRAQRTCRSMLLLLVEFKAHRERDGCMDGWIANKLFTALTACVREVDFIGWYRTDRVAGAVLTQGAEAPASDAAQQIGERVARGMGPLSIIDLSGAPQPIFNEDGTVAVFYNGEIYNYLELRAELEAKGHRFSTNSDTEVIVHLWEEEGVEFPRRLNGMFAIALYDRVKRRLVLVRDHVGIKPLYYALGADGIVFGSEVKVVLASGRVGRTLDVDALGQYLAWEYVPGAGTLLREVRRLEPARSLEIDLESGRTTLRRYWSPLSAAGGEPARSDGDADKKN